MPRRGPCFLLNLVPPNRCREKRVEVFRHENPRIGPQADQVRSEAVAFGQRWHHGRFAHQLQAPVRPTHEGVPGLKQERKRSDGLGGSVLDIVQLKAAHGDIRHAQDRHSMGRSLALHRRAVASLDIGVPSVRPSPQVGKVVRFLDGIIAAWRAQRCRERVLGANPRSADPSMPRPGPPAGTASESPAPDPGAPGPRSRPPAAPRRASARPAEAPATPSNRRVGGSARGWRWRCPAQTA